MAWIALVPPEEARGKLKELYDKAAAAGNGTVGPMIQAGSLNPDALEGRTLMYRALMFGGASSLSRAEREMLAVATSAANRCHY
jgi:alkylhydroperoxidase family enzyme